MSIELLPKNIKDGLNLFKRFFIYIKLMNRFKSSIKVNNSRNGNNKSENSKSISHSDKSAIKPAHVVLPAEQPRGLLGTLAESAVMGAGSTIGSRVVDAIMGPRTIQVENKQNTTIENCSEQYKQFYQCIKDASNNCDNILSDKCKQDKN
jgi:hypothetical protein